MTGLLMLATFMVIITMSTAILTARQLETLKQELLRLEQRKGEARARLQDALDQKQAAEGTRNLLKNVAKAKADHLKQMQEELELLKEEVVENRDISISAPLHAKPLDE
jgi:hypothetical protein